jgi:hypothetical protein
MNEQYVTTGAEFELTRPAPDPAIAAESSKTAKKAKTQGKPLSRAAHHPAAKFWEARPGQKDI